MDEMFDNKKTQDILRLSTDLQCELIRKLASEADYNDLLEDLLMAIAEKTHAVINADTCSVFLIGEPTKFGILFATMRAATGYQKKNINTINYKIVSPEKVTENPSDENRLGITGWVISTGRAFISSSTEDVNNHPHHLEQGVPEDRKLGAFLVVPLRNPRGQIIGALKSERLEGSEQFSVNDQIILESYAKLTGQCYAHLEDAISGDPNTAITAWVLGIISEAVSGEGELDAFLDIVVNVISAACLADSCSVFLKDESMKTLTQRAGCGHLVLRRTIRSYKLPDEKQLEHLERNVQKLTDEEKIGLTSWIASTGKSFYASNYEELRKHPHHKGTYDKQNFLPDQKCGAFYGSPLRVGGTIIGVLKIENLSKKDAIDCVEFPIEIRRRSDALAQSVALAIERLQIQILNRYRIILNARPTIFEILRGDLNISELMNKIVEETAALFNARACALFLKERGELIQRAAVGYATRGPKRKYTLVERKDILDEPESSGKKGLTLYIAVKREKFTAKSNLELTLHPHHEGTYDEFNFEGTEKCESFMGMPLIIGEELLGVLKVETKMRYVGDDQEFSYFNEQDELVFEFIAYSAAIAIQNARLMESSRLADKLLAQPNLNDVLSELYYYLQDRGEGFTTLDRAKDIVEGKDKNKAKIIESFTAILDPSFFPAILDQLANLLKEPFSGYLKFIEDSIRAENYQTIIKLRDKEINKAALTRKNFVARQSAEFLLDNLEKITYKLRQYKENLSQKKRLQECLTIVENSGIVTKEMNLFEKRLLDRVFSNWAEVFKKTLINFHLVPNPYIAGPPIPPESPLFYGRRDIFFWLEQRFNQEKNNVIILHGSSRTGKTSILKQLYAGPLGKNLRERTRSPLIPIFIDMLKVADKGTGLFLLHLAENISTHLQAHNIKIKNPNSDDYLKENSAYFRAFDLFLKNATSIIKGETGGILTIILDEFEILEELVTNKKIELEIFRYLRSQMQHQPGLSFILAGHEKLDNVDPMYKDLIFNVAYHKEVGYLDYRDAKNLIIEPLKDYGISFDDEVVENILELTGGHPYFIQQLCSACIETLNLARDGYNINTKHLNKAVETILTVGSYTTLHHLWNKAGIEGQRLLAEIATLLDKNNKHLATIEEISNSTKKNLGMSKTAVLSLLDALVKQHIIKCIYKAKQKQYCFSTDLLRLYVFRELNYK